MVSDNAAGSVQQYRSWLYKLLNYRANMGKSLTCTLLVFNINLLVCVFVLQPSRKLKINSILIL